MLIVWHQGESLERVFIEPSGLAEPGAALPSFERCYQRAAGHAIDRPGVVTEQLQILLRLSNDGNLRLRAYGNEGTSLENRRKINIARRSRARSSQRAPPRDRYAQPAKCLRVQFTGYFQSLGDLKAADGCGGLAAHLSVNDAVIVTELLEFGLDSQDNVIRKCVGEEKGGQADEKPQRGLHSRVSNCSCQSVQVAARQLPIG